MTERPEIDPEIRGLIEEIVADSASAIRLVPRAPLRKWFERGEAARVADVAETAAEKYLVSAHREALARTLIEGAAIAYWKAPGPSHRPRGPGGIPYDEVVAERAWLPLAIKRAEIARDAGVELLRECLVGIRPQSAQALARASLNLVPRYLSHVYCAFTLPPNSVRTAIHLLQGLAHKTSPPDARSHVLSIQAQRVCSLGDYRRARELYTQASQLLPHSPLNHFYAFNLSCVLGDTSVAAHEADQLASLVTADDPTVGETRRILRQWYQRQTADKNRAKEVASRLRGTIPHVASVLCQEMES